MAESRKKIKVFEAADIPKLYRDIFESYHNDSDLLSELLQNAVDSIRIADPINPLIEITFNSKNKLLKIKDNGIGMTSEDLEDFAIGRTKKGGPQFSSLGGEKGIGSSFIFGGSDQFFIETCKEGKLTIAECRNAYDSIMANQEPEFYILEEDRNERLPNYTEIQVTGKLFYLDYRDRDEIEYLLRTYTAVGYTLPLVQGKPLNIKVKLTWVDEKGEEASKQVANTFRHPSIDWPDKVIEYQDTVDLNEGFGQFLSYVDTEREAIGIFGESNLFREYKLPTGILLSVKGYPTVVEVAPPKTGYAGYWGRSVLILINDDMVVLDAGRKSVNSEARNRIRNIAKDVFNKLVRHHKLFIRQTEHEAEKAILDDLKEEANDLPQLNIEGIAYQKVPIFEQGVVAIFHELIGSGKITGYFPLSASTDTRYDEIMFYKVPVDDLGDVFKEKYLEGRRNVRDKDSFYKQKIVVEYKLNAVDIMRDLKKDIRFIDLLIAFDCDTSKLRTQWKWVPLEDKDIIYNGAKYKIGNPQNDYCQVLLLKDFIGNRE